MTAELATGKVIRNTGGIPLGDISKKGDNTTFYPFSSVTTGISISPQGRGRGGWLSFFKKDPRISGILGSGVRDHWDH
jgi:hypothetical protein